MIMRVVALISGGKDSSYNLLQCLAAGHEVVALANLQPRFRDELDSFMYQTVGHQGIDLYAEATGLPLFKKKTSGIAHNNEKLYKPRKGDEVEDLYLLLSKIKEDMHIDGVSTGAILSDYQRVRVENVCSRLGLVSLAYLWRRDQAELLQEMIDTGVEAIVIKVAALGLDPTKHLGMRLQEIMPHLTKMNQKYGLNICGEGGEYETFTLDCPFFNKKIVIDEFETVIHSDDAFAPVGYLNFKKLSLMDKLNSESASHSLNDKQTSSVKGPIGYICNLELDLDDEQLVENIVKEDEQHPDGGDEVVFSNSVIAQNYCDMLFFQNLRPNINVNGGGWCWLGSFVGQNTDPCIALSNALTKLVGCLSSKQYSIKDLVSVTVLVNDISQYSQLNSIYCEIIDINNAPVRICLQTELPKNSSVLIEAVAHRSVINKSSSNCEHESDRRTLHVQSVSHWAPANIGPYSQAIKVGDIIYVAGQIGLIPGSMEMIDGGISKECNLALRHVNRIINSIDQGTLLRDVVQVTCFVTCYEYIHSARKEWEKRSKNALADYIVVSVLPRNAKIEWQVWAHRGNACFQYEETGCHIDERHRAFLRRRFNYENTVSAVVCYLIKADECIVETDTSSITNNVEKLNAEHVEKMFTYILSKLMSGEPQTPDSVCNLRIFYPICERLVIDYVHDILMKLKESLSLTFTLIPAIQLHHVNTILSVSAVRHY